MVIDADKPAPRERGLYFLLEGLIVHDDGVRFTGGTPTRIIMGISRFARNDNYGGAFLKYVISNPWKGEKSLSRLNINPRTYGRRAYNRCHGWS